MLTKIFLAVLGALIGVSSAYIIATKTEILNFNPGKAATGSVLKIPQKEVVGFLPFWLLDKAKTDYSDYITQLSYFNLTIDSDGTIKKFTNAVEADPGWNTLTSGKADPFLNTAKEKGVTLSLTVFNGDTDSITKMLENPGSSGQNLVRDVAPIMQQYGFTDLNLDVEDVAEASPSAREKYSRFVATVKNNLGPNTTLTIDVSPIAFVKNTNLVDPTAVVQNVDHILLMAYDFHNPGSFVTGPVSPIGGAGVVSEFDTESAIENALSIMPPYKLILGIPLYGYTWETVNPNPRSATLPASSLIISSRTVSDLLASCATCSAEFDNTDGESHVIYKNSDTGTYQQIFYPDGRATQLKIDLANKNNLGGIGLWALGYEDGTILSPLAAYRH